MSHQFSAEQVVEALYQGILNRQPDPIGMETALHLLDDPKTLPDLVRSLVTSSERFSLETKQAHVLRALYKAALGREPDSAGRELYASWMLRNFDEGTLDIADALHNSAEFQDRILPFDPERVIVDHSPNGESRFLIRHLVRPHGRSGTIVEVGVLDPSRTISLDLAKLFNWRAVLIEGNPDRKIPIQSRFSGTNYDLLCEHALTRDEFLPPHSSHADRLRLESRHRRATELGLPLPSAQVQPLAEILERARIEAHFDILVLGEAKNSRDAFEDLIRSQYRPKVAIIMGLTIPDCTSLSQLGFSQMIGDQYALLTSTSGSITLARSAPRDS